MQGSAVILVQLLLFSALAGAALTTTAVGGVEAYPERGPIRINGNSDLMCEPPILPVLPSDCPDNGVRSGDGTAQNPFVIERWKIEQGGLGEPPAVWISSTSLHIVIRSVEIWTNRWEGDQSVGIRLDDVRNIAVENVQFSGFYLPMVVSGSRIALSDMVLDQGTIQLDHANGVVIRNVVFEGAHASLLILNSEADLTDSRFNQTTDEGRRPVQDRDGNVQSYLLVNGIQVGCQLGSPAAPSRVTLENVSVRSFEAEAALSVRCGSTAEIRDSEFMASHAGIHVESGRLHAERIVMSANGFGVLVEPDSEGAFCDCQIRDSKFLSNGIHLDNRGTGQIDAEGNWWGSAGGPKAGSIAGSVDYEPWLRAPPWSEEGDSEETGAGGMSLVLALFLVVVSLARRRQARPRAMSRPSNP